MHAYSVIDFMLWFGSKPVFHHGHSDKGDGDHVSFDGQKILHR
jgi:hypothetical protein